MVTEKSIKKLTVSIWILSILIIVDISVSIYSAMAPKYVAKRSMAYIADGEKVVPAKDYTDPYENFYHWPLDKKIERASVILLIEWDKDGPMLKAMIKEILKIEPNTVLYYKVGQEFESQSLYPKENTSYGDGQLVFMTGSPASMRVSTTHENGRLLGMGNMPIEILREKIKKLK